MSVDPKDYTTATQRAEAAEAFGLLRDEIDRAAELLTPDGCCYVDVLHAVALLAEQTGHPREDKGCR